MYAAIDAIVHDDALPTASVCDVLGVSRSAYYAWRDGEPSGRAQREAALTPLVRAVFWKHRRRYGARRIAEELADLDEVCSPRRVAGILKTQGLRAIQPKSFVPKTTDSRHHWGYSPNLILDTREPGGVNRLWVGDITYVPLRGGGFCYLATLMDRYSRDIAGWELAETMTDELTLSALRMAIRDRQPAAELVHHTDRGGQYASGRYRAVLRRAGMRQSMSRAGNCYDNAFMESCFGTFKTELEMTEYEDQRAARRQIAEYIDYYRNDRKHSALGYRTPTQFERLASCGS
ncbi:MAG TPA: IS3 family transposase [Bryobacteraceae bacterium]